MKIISRHPLNPILDSRNMPVAMLGGFLPSVCKWQGQYYLVYRNERSKTGTAVELMSSKDGIHWDSKPVTLVTMPTQQDRIAASMGTPQIFITGAPQIFAYDNSLFVSYKVAKPDGITTTTIVTTDLIQWCAIHSHNRDVNMYHFPLPGLTSILFQTMPYARSPHDEYDVWFGDLSNESTTPRGVLSYRDIAYANMGLSLNSQPVLTSRGWLVVFKAASATSTAFWNKKISYVVGAAILDLINPWKVLGVSKEPIMKPEMQYEIEGKMRIVHPCSAVLETPRELRLYYTPPDDVLCLATADVDDVIDACL